MSSPGVSSPGVSSPGGVSPGAAGPGVISPGVASSGAPAAGSGGAGAGPAGATSDASPSGAAATGTGESAAAGDGTAGAAGAAPREERDIKPKAFLLLDDAGNPVLVPGMTFEKLDQLLRMQEGWQQPSQLYAIQSVEVRGRVLEASAELNVTVRIELEPTDGKWVSVPLRMANFHRTGPADISGVESYRMDLDDSDGGYVLHLQSDSRRSVVVAMRVVCRVAPPPGSAIEFRLPEATSRVVLDVPSPGVSASVDGRGDEVLRTESEQNTTQVSVTGGGGNFSLRFGTQLPVLDTRPTLESESRIVVDWQQADNAPLAIYDIAVRSQRGDLPPFTLAMPGPVHLAQQPVVRGGAPFEIVDSPETDLRRGSGQAAEPASSDAPPDAQQLIEVVPSGGRGDSRAEISLVMQLHSEGGRPGGTVVIRGVSLRDAVEQTGEIEIRTPRDYRLRWNSQPWVSSLWDKTDTDSLSTRKYTFRFDRVPFELPIWLSARAKQLRVEGDYRVTFYDTLASLRIVLRTSGGMPDSRVLPLNVGPWKVQSLFVAGTTTPIEADQNGDLLEIDLASLPGGGESDRIEIVLVHPLAEANDRVELSLPSISSDNEALGTLASTLSVSAQSDYRFIADLASSTGIGEVVRVQGPSDPSDSASAAAPGSAAGPRESLHESRYTLPDISSPGTLVGFLVADRPQVSYQADAEISIAGNRLVEVLTWTVYPHGGLRGRLPISWGPADEMPLPLPEPLASDGSAQAADAQAVYRLPATPLWSVSVDDTEAVLRADAGGSYSIYSDRLSGGPHKLILRRSRDLPPPTETPADGQAVYRLAGINLPRPGITDSTLRGAMVVRLRGDQGMELTAQDSQSRWSDELLLTSPPSSELPVRVRYVEQGQDDVRVRRAVLRTALGRNTQHDYLIASVHGGGLFRLPLVGVPLDALVRGSVDEVAAEVFRDNENHCFVRLGDKGNHRVSIQVWAPRESSLLVDTVAPLLRLPLGTERFYWEIVTPEDDHLVWASPTAGRAMQWHFDRWRLHRRAEHTEAKLASWVGAAWETQLPPGNRYLFVGVDAAALSAVMMSRVAIWLIVGTSVLLVSCLLTYFPAMRHPLLAVTAAVLLGGMTLLLPDASVLVGQVMLVAMLMVAVMAGVSHLLAPRRAPRVLSTTADRVEPSSSRIATASRSAAPAVVAEMAPSGSAAEDRG